MPSIKLPLSAVMGAAVIGAATIGGSLLVAPSALAQKPVGGQDVASILFWTQKQQLERYPAIEKTYEVRTIAKGPNVRPLPLADRQINPTISFNGRASEIDAFMKDNRISGVIALKDGQIVLEKYALGRKPEDRWTTFSVAKSLTSILVGAAIEDGWIDSVYDPVTKYLPELAGSAYDGVSLHRLMSMTTGVAWSEDYTNPRSDVALASQAPYLGPHPISGNPLMKHMQGLRREAEPGKKWVYKTGETDLAGLALVRALSGKPLSVYASEKLWRPFGMEQDAVWMVDKAGIERGGCCMSATLRDYARMGLFLLGDGQIDATRVLPEGYLDAATTNRIPAAARRPGESYGYFWWPREDGAGYAARGIFGQGIEIYPEENLVIVVNSAMPKASDRTQSQKIQALTQAIRQAANGG